MKIRSLATIDFPPFARGRLDFPPVPDRPKELAEVHLLTGVNGAGKSRVLCALAAVLGEEKPLKERCAGSGPGEFAVELTAPKEDLPFRVQMLVGKDGVSMKGARSEILRAAASQLPAFACAGGAYLREPDEEELRREPYYTPNRTVSGQARFSRLLFHKPPSHSGDFVQALANLLVQDAIDAQAGKGRSRPQRVLETILAGLQATTGTKVAFELAAYPVPSLRVRWGGDSLALNQIPDGLRALLGWMVDAALMCDVACGGELDPFTAPAVFLFDEVEAHLHPKWQRKLLPAFQRMFPAAQIFVATHSPFVISSLNCGWIHVLKPGKAGKFIAQEPKAASPGDSYPSVLAEIMDVEEWYDVETEKLLTEFRKLRDSALAGDARAVVKARALGQKIGQRGHELAGIMGAELARLPAVSTGLPGPGGKSLKHGLPGPAGRGLAKK